MPLSQNRKSIFFLSVLVLTVFLFFLSVQNTFAAKLSDFTTYGLISNAVDGVDSLVGSGSDLISGLAAWFTKIALFILLMPIYLIGLFGFLVLSLAGIIVDYVFSLNIDVISAPVIANGFNTVLAVANLGFVIAIIIIAFATIFRNQTYGMKQMLWKLVVAAVLVNFSLLIAGTILDFSHALALEFVRAMSDGASTLAIGDKIVAQFGPQIPLLTTEARAIGDIFGAALIQTALETAYGTVSTWIMAIIMIGLALMLLIRYIYLIILIVLMPLSWLFWITPRFTHLHRDWWDKFFQQTLYLPAITFFIWLASDPDLKLTTLGTIGSGARAGLGIWGIADGLIIATINLFVIGALLVGGLIAAEKLGAAGAGVAMGLARGAGRKARSMSWQYAGKPMTAPIRSGYRLTKRAVGRVALGFKGVAGSGAEKISWKKMGTAGRVARAAIAGVSLGTSELALGAAKTFSAGAGKAGAALYASGDTGKEVAEKEAAEIDKNAKTDKAREAYYGTATSAEGRAGEIVNALKHDLVEELFAKYKGRKDQLTSAAKAHGIADDLKKIKPELAADLASKEDREKVAQSLAGEKVIKRHEAEKFDDDHIRNLSPAQQAKLKKDGDEFSTVVDAAKGIVHTLKRQGDRVEFYKTTDVPEVLRKKLQKEGDETKSTPDADGKINIAKRLENGTIVVSRTGEKPSEKEIDKQLKYEAAEKAKEKAGQWSKETLANEDVVSAMNVAQVNAVGRTADSNKIDALVATLKKLDASMRRLGTSNATPADRERQMHMGSAQNERLTQILKFWHNNPSLVRGYGGGGKKKAPAAGAEEGGGAEESET